MSNASSPPPPRPVGRYLMFGEIASGGMASVHFGLLNGPVGFRRTVAIKRLHEQLARDPEFVSQFLDEARLAARIRHPNVVQTLDVVAERGELLLVMEYVDGETLAKLLNAYIRSDKPFPIDKAVACVAGALHGLHSAHDATDEHGLPLRIVHRDVSPQNILVGRDGVPRVLDFGVAKASARIHSTQGAQIKGKIRYMSPEQVRGREVDRRTDVFAAGVVLWQALTGKRLFDSPEGPAAIINQVLTLEIPNPSSLRADVPPELDAVVMRALERRLEKRYQNASELAVALEEAIRIPSTHSLGAWVIETAGEALDERARVIARIERHHTDDRSRSDTLSDLSSSARIAARLRSADSSREATAALEEVPADTAASLGEQSNTTQLSAWTSTEAVRRRRRQVVFTTGGFLAIAGAAMALAFSVVRGSSNLSEDAGAQPAAVQPADPSNDLASTVNPEAATGTGTPDDAPSRSEPDDSAPSQDVKGQDVKGQDVKADDLNLEDPPKTNENTEDEPKRALPTPSATVAPQPPAPKPAPVRTPTVRKPPPQQANCSNPFYIDEKGIRRFKRECL